VITSLRGTARYAERAVAPADALIDVPDDVTLPDAVALRPTIGQTFPLERASDARGDRSTHDPRQDPGGRPISCRLKVAVRLHPGADGTAANAPEQARHAEQLGLDGIFVGDHLKPAGPLSGECGRTETSCSFVDCLRVQGCRPRLSRTSRGRMFHVRGRWSDGNRAIQKRPH
jgi:hypothetical protein